jgi:hypothetical protein
LYVLVIFIRKFRRDGRRMMEEKEKEMRREGGEGGRQHGNGGQ